VVGSANGSWWVPAGDGIELAVRVTAGARRSEVVDRAGERLRLRLAAPPTDGRANAELARLLGGLFGVRAAAVTIVRGTRSREKVVRIAGVDGVPAPLLGAPGEG
jgi:uncharacterized protein (TIGR00251 family)